MHARSMDYRCGSNGNISFLSIVQSAYDSAALTEFEMSLESTGMRKQLFNPCFSYRRSLPRRERRYETSHNPLGKQALITDETASRLTLCRVATQ